MKQCVTCSGGVGPRHHAVECDTCHEWTHRRCTEPIVLQEVYRAAVATDADIHYICTVCVHMIPDREVAYEDHERHEELATTVMETDDRERTFDSIYCTKRYQLVYPVKQQLMTTELLIFLIGGKSTRSKTSKFPYLFDSIVSGHMTTNEEDDDLSFTKMATIFKRKLDLAPTASIDTVALNNKVVSMREVVKQARVHTINKMTKKIKKLRAKKGTDDQKKQNTEKAGRLVQEIKIIQLLKPDYVSKYALGSTDKFSIVVCKAKMETRALARLAEHPIMQKIVKDFREKHTDWKDLAAYLMTKHTSREFKKKDKQNMTKVATNVQATETIVQTYLDEKLGLGESGIEGKGVDGHSVKQGKSLAERLRNISDGKVSVGSEDEGSVSVLKTNGKKKRLSEGLDIAKGKSAEKEVDLDSNNETGDHSDEEDTGVIHESDKSNGSESEDNSDNSDNSVSEHGSLQNSSDSDSLDTGSEEQLTRIKKINKDSVKSKTETKARNKTEDEIVKPIVRDKVVGEMVVQKIDLSTLEPDDTDTIAKDKEIPIFLLESDSIRKEGQKRKKKDAFFDTGDDDDDGDDGGDNEPGIDGEDDADLDYSGPGKHFQTNRTVDTKGDMHRGLKALSTTFLGSLSSSKMMSCKDSEFRTNEDWKRIRHEIKEKKLTSERGWGQGSFRGGANFRDRGGFHGDQRGGRGGHISRGAIRGSRGRGGQRPMERGAPRGPRQFQRGDGRPFRNDAGMPANRGLNKDKPVSGGAPGEKMHPSWEASRKRKEQQTAVQAFQGKKIKFDDD